MSLKAKRIVSILLTAAFAIAMLTSCSVVNEDPVILKVAGRQYTYKDYTEIFNNNIYTYVYSGGEAEYCPNYAELSSTERLKKFQDYAYEQLIEQAAKDYLIEEYKLESKLTDDDKKAIEENVNEALEQSASSYENDVQESSTTLDEMKDKGYKLTDEEQSSIETTANTQIEAAVAAKMSTGDASGSDAANSDTAASDTTKSDDTAKSDDTTGSDSAVSYMTREDAEKAVAEEAGFKTFDEYKASVKEDVEFDLYFAYYKKDAAMDAYKKSFDNKKDETFESHKKDVEETEKLAYLRDTKLPEELTSGGVTDDQANEYYNKKVAEYKTMADEKASDYYSYLNEATENGDIVWYTADGYYFVKHILIKNVEDDTAASDTTESGKANVDPAVQKKVENDLEKVKAETSEEKKLAEFDKLVEKYGEDPGMQQEPAKTSGYLMGDGNSMVKEFSDACEKLYNNGKGKIGDISEAVVSEHGVHYIQLVSKLEAGEAGYESVIDEAKKGATEEYKTEQIEKTIAETMKKISITKYEARIRSVGNGYEDMYFGNSTQIGG